MAYSPQHLEPGHDARAAAAWLVQLPASATERRRAALVVLVSLGAFAVAAAWAKLKLPPVWAFIPIYESALVLLDLITAVLLFGQCRIDRSRALLMLASGYLFTAAATVAHALTFPDLFTATGLLGAGAQSTAWLYMFWHGGFPLFVIAYTLLRGSRFEPLRNGVRGGAAVAAAGVAALAGAAAVAALATAGQDALPALMSGKGFTPAQSVAIWAVWLASLFALALLLWRRRPLAVLDLWLCVVMCAWLFDIALSGMLNASRFDVGFYSGRIYGLLATSFVLMRLLLENSVLHAEVLDAHVNEQRRSAELQRLTQQLVASNAQLNDTNQQLQEQSRFKSEFLANMSHELRTPLNAVIGFSEILKDGMAGALTERQRSFAGHIFNGGHHLLELINDILDLSKIEAGKMDIQLEPVPLVAALKDALAMVATLAQQRNVRVELELHGELGTLRLDRRRLTQIALNLVTNAIKFTASGGQVTVRVDVADRARATSAMPGHKEGLRMPLPADGATHFVEISVSDTGIGITRDDIHQLFKPFTQISNRVTRSVEGTGLGLVMVHRLAELHGGTVAVTSEVGRGSCFTVWLPWREGIESARAGQPVRAKPVPARPQALVVEDNGEAAVLLMAQLESQGFAVRRVPSAEGALALVDEYTPDLITLDIRLPGMDGWELLARLQTIPDWSDVPVVVVSVVADQGKGFSLGASLVLQKPIERGALARGLERLGLKPGAQHGISVLVIDDDAATVELLASQLSQHSYVVLRALGGREGIELARRRHPDVITLDLEMPEVNGFDVVEALKAAPDTAQIPIVVVTARNLSAADRRRLDGHISNIVGRSAAFSEEEFVGEVQRALAHRA